MNGQQGASFGPGGAAYRNPGIVVSKDGSLKDNGRMGTPFVPMGDRLPAHSVAVLGSASSTQPKLTNIALALEESPSDEDLTILAESLVAVTTLSSVSAEWTSRSRFTEMLACSSHYTRGG
jgi:hypothetical protein